MQTLLMLLNGEVSLEVFSTLSSNPDNPEILNFQK